MVALLVTTQSGLTPATAHELQQQIVSIYTDVSVGLWVEKPVAVALVVSMVRALTPIPVLRPKKGSQKSGTPEGADLMRVAHSASVLRTAT